MKQGNVKAHISFQVGLALPFEVKNSKAVFWLQTCSDSSLLISTTYFIMMVKMAS